MKPTLLTTLFSFLLFAFTTQNTPLVFSQDAEQVKDTFGNPISTGDRYFIFPGIRAPTGGGIFLGKLGNQTCPITILQDFSDLRKSKAVKFSIAADVSTGIIFTGTPLNIAFEEKPGCAKSSKWVVVQEGKDIIGAWVGIGSVENHSGKNVLSGNFKIEKYGFFYKLKFCPTSYSDLPPGVCLDIGRRDDKNGRRLVLPDSHDPFQVTFLDVGANGISTII